MTVVAGARDAVTTVLLRGELDLASAAAFDEAVDDLVAAGQSQIEVDVSGLSFCDSVGLNALVRAKNRCLASGGRLRVVRAQGEVAQIINISGLLDSLAPER